MGGVQSIEAGEAGSVDSYVRLAEALGLRLEFDLIDPRRKQGGTARWSDPVHSGMGEFEAAHLRKLNFPVRIDEPYQHYQFAGRADLVAWDVDTCALLHIENRTRFPDLQEMAGSFNAKRAYLGPILADRLSVRHWRSETHVIAGLWSAEILHSLRMRTETFRSLCPDPIDGWAAWWAGQPPASGVRSILVVIDPQATGRQRSWLGLADALTTKPRYRGYADAASAMMLGSG